MRRQAGYRADLAFIHDAGFSGFAGGSAPALIALLRRAGLRGGRVVDLGCGAGTTARRLGDAGYGVLGIDASPAMIARARAAAPGATFRVGSFVDAPLPRCVAVMALGEVFNYRFDRRNDYGALARTFRRVHDALVPGGLFVFDVSGPGRVPGGGPTRGFTEGPTWAVLVERREDRAHQAVTRRIITFRRVGGRYRRDEELHHLRLLPPAEVLASLRRAGFRARAVRGYGRVRFPAGVTGFVARKPPRS